MFHNRALPDNSVYATKPTNASMWTVFITCYSLPTCFNPFAIIIRVIYRIIRNPNKLLNA